MRHICLGILGFLIISAVGGGSLFAQQATYDIPRIDRIAIDGEADDWRDGGFRVDVMNQRSFEGLTPENFDPRCRFAWNEEGLLALFEVRDDVPLEQERPENIWMWDNVRLIITPDPDLGRPAEVRIAPGADPERPGLKIEFPGLSAEATTPTLRVQSTVEPGRYTVEILYAWPNLSRPLTQGDTIEVEAIVADIDEEDKNMWWWGHEGRFHANLRLSAKASDPILAVATCQYDRLRTTRIQICAATELIGHRVRVFEGRRHLAETALEERDERALATIEFPMPSIGGTWDDLRAVVGRNKNIPINAPDARETRGQAFTGMDLAFNPGYAFEGENFPRVDFRDSFMAEALIGSYTMETTFFDKDYNEVEKAEEPGRYGAVVTITPEHGRVTHRFRTVVRMPDRSRHAIGILDVSMYPSSGMGIPPEADSVLERQINETAGGALRESLMQRSGGIALLAALMESRDFSEIDRATYDAWAAERQWWVTFKRQFYGTGHHFPQPFVSPVRNEGPPTPTVREGSPAEAGMSAEGIAEIDALLRRWADDSDQAFAVCIVRHGTIALHKAYGMRGEEPMTVETPSWIASITKLFSASLMMQLVDRGLVDLDAPIADYLPVMRDIPVEKPITVRNLYTHTGGLWGHWGDDLNDMEEVIADYYHLLAADKLSFYNGTGNSLGSKIIENVTGVALPQFYRKHLLDPLGCENTIAYDSGGGIQSVPLDMAKIGQMLLNGGSYGDMRFMRRESVEAMFPSLMTAQFGENTARMGNVGMQWMSGTRFSDRTMTHGSASNSLFAVDFENDMVVTMTRNAAGANYDKYHTQFVNAVLRAIAD